MRGPADGWLVRGGFRFHYLTWTPEPDVERAPPIFFLHGLSSNARYWERVASHLEGRRLIAIDQRGHGLTGQQPDQPSLPDGYAIKELLDDVEFAISELQLDGPVVVGHSWGATVALELVGTRPGLASGLVFIDGPVQSAANLFSWDEAQRFMQPPLPRYRSFAAGVADSKRDFGGAWDSDLEAFVRARIMPEGTGFVLTLTAAVRLELLRGLYDSQPDVLWPRVEVPAVALLASQSPAGIARSKHAGVEKLSAIAPQVEVRWFDTPHDIPLFMPSEIAEQIELIASRASEAPPSEATAG